MLGAVLVLKVKGKNGGWLSVPNKGKIKVDYDTAAGLVGGAYLERINEDDGTDEFQYTTNIHTKRIKNMNKLPKEELYAFVMYMWKSNIEPAPVISILDRNPIQQWVRSISKEFKIWLPERKFYLKIVRSIVDF